LIGSLLFASIAQGATLCASGDNLISAVCDATGFTITVDETCRGTGYSWIDWTSTFIDGVIGTVEWDSTTAPATECQADGTGSAWEYTVAFTECNLADPVVDTSTVGTDGITWYTYSLYLNYDNVIATAQGTGNLQQLDQTLIQCRIPKNLQENGIPGTITITDTGDIVPDVTSDVDLWDMLQLDVAKGGNAVASSFDGTYLLPDGSDASVELGEHIKLKINMQTDYTGTDPTTTYNIAIKDCWASTVSNVQDASDLDNGAIDFDATGVNIGGVASAHETVKFLEDQCPMYSWVTGVTTDAATNKNLEIELRQFAFNGALTSGFYYHCEVDICIPTTAGADNDAGDCVPLSLFPCGVSSADNTPGGRRRRAIISSKRVTRATYDESSGGDSTTLTLDMENCAETETVDGITTCVAQKKSSAQAAALSVLTGALFCALH